MSRLLCVLFTVRFSAMHYIARMKKVCCNEKNAAQIVGKSAVNWSQQHFVVFFLFVCSAFHSSFNLKICSNLQTSACDKTNQNYNSFPLWWNDNLVLTIFHFLEISPNTKFTIWIYFFRLQLVRTKVAVGLSIHFENLKVSLNISMGSKFQDPSNSTTSLRMHYVVITCVALS